MKTFWNFLYSGMYTKGKLKEMNVITHQQKMEKSTKSKWDSQADTSHSCSKARWRVAFSHTPLSECCLAEQSLFTKFNSKQHRVWTKRPFHEKALCSYAKVYSLLHMIQPYCNVLYVLNTSTIETLHAVGKVSELVFQRVVKNPLRRLWICSRLRPGCSDETSFFFGEVTSRSALIITLLLCST